MEKWYEIRGGLGGMDKLELAQDRDSWRILLMQ